MATLHKLVQKLAFRIGSKVNAPSLGNDLGINRLTVEKNIDILVKTLLFLVCMFLVKIKITDLKKDEKYIYGI